MKYNTINLENSHSQKILSLGSLDYLNAKYQGYLKDFSCESIGALLWDNGYFYIGQWKKNKIHGKGLFIFPNGSYIYSTFFEDKLHGLAIMKFASGCMMVGNWDFNKKNGLFLYFDKEKNSWFLCQHTIKQKNPEIINEEIVKGENFPVFLEYYPALQKLLKENVFSLLEDDLKDNHLAYTKWQDNLEYFGFIIDNNVPQGLGFFKKEDQIIYFGEFGNGVMKGYGRALSSLQIYDGIFDQGLLQGIGVHYNIKEKTYVFGEFNKNSCTNIISSGSGFPKNLLFEFKIHSHRKSKVFYKTQINSKIQNLFIEYHISKKLSPHHSDSLQNIESNLDNKTPTEDNLIKKSFEKKISTPEKKDLEILTSKTPKKIPKILPIVLKSKNPKISAEGSNKKIEKSPISIKPEQKIESLTKKIEEPTENIKKQAISRKIEGLLDVSKCPQAQVVSTPLKNKKVEGLSGNENLILYEIKANGLTSLRKQLIDPSEESRYSIQSQDNMTKSNILERFLVNFEEEEEFEEQKFH